MLNQINNWHNLSSLLAHLSLHEFHRLTEQLNCSQAIDSWLIQIHSNNTSTVIPLFMALRTSSLQHEYGDLYFVVDKDKVAKVNKAFAKELIELPPVTEVTEGATLDDALLSINRLLEITPALQHDYVEIRNTNIGKVMNHFKRKNNLKSVRFIMNSLEVVNYKIS